MSNRKCEECREKLLKELRSYIDAKFIEFVEMENKTNSLLCSMDRELVRLAAMHNPYAIDDSCNRHPLF